MKKNRFFRSLSLMWKGFVRVIDLVLGWLGFTKESRFLRACRTVILLSLACLAMLFALVGCCEFYDSFMLRKVVYPYLVDDVYNSFPLSNDIEFQSLRYRETGRVVDINTSEVLLDGVDWVVMSPDKDSLAVFCRYGKRGYLNRFTGQVAIQPVYTKAWVFSESLAAVADGNRLLFVDHSGRVVIDGGFQPCRWGADQVFRGGHCKVYDPLTEKVGLIDHQGRFVLEPIYDNLYYEYGYWLVTLNECMGLFHPDRGMLFKPEHLHVFLTQNFIKVLHTDRITRQYDPDGKLLVDLVISRVEPLEYRSDRYIVNETDGSTVYVTETAECSVYSAEAEDYYELKGLMDSRGNCLTPPLYDDITAISRNRFLCHPQGVILDSQGRVVDYQPTELNADKP